MLMLTSKNYYLKDDFLKAFAEAMGFPVKVMSQPGRITLLSGAKYSTTH